jgi:hypothetical protein
MPVLPTGLAPLAHDGTRWACSCPLVVRKEDDAYHQQWHAHVAGYDDAAHGRPMRDGVMPWPGHYRDGYVTALHRFA